MYVHSTLHEMNMIDFDLIVNVTEQFFFLDSHHPFTFQLAYCCIVTYYELLSLNVYLGGTTSLTVATFCAGDMQQFSKMSVSESVIGSLGREGVLGGMYMRGAYFSSFYLCFHIAFRTEDAKYTS